MMKKIIGIESAYREALSKPMQNMTISANLVKELIENLEIPECLKGFVQKDDTNNVVKNVTFWSSYCAEGITDYEALKEYEKEKDGAMSTTVTIRDEDINAIVNVFEQESHGQLFFHIHVEGV